MGDEKIDDVDRALLATLAEDATKIADELASEIDIPISEVHKRIEELERKDIIKRFTAVVDPSKIGYSTWTYHYALLVESFAEELKGNIEYFAKGSGSQMACVLLGEYDLLFRKLHADRTDVHRFSESLRIHPDTPNYADIETFVVSKKIRWRSQNIPKIDRRNFGQTDISSTERKVLGRLMDDARLRVRPERIADQIGVDTDKIQKAIGSLERKNLVIGYTADINMEMLDWFRANIGVSTLLGESGRVEGQLLKLDPLNVPYIFSGPGFHWQDIGLEVICESLSRLYEIVQRIHSMDGIGETRTLISPKQSFHDRQMEMRYQ